MEEKTGRHEVSDLKLFSPSTPKLKQRKSKRGKDKEKSKARTPPSGQVINTSVKDIRNFFTEKGNLAKCDSQSSMKLNSQCVDECKEQASNSLPDHDQSEWSIVKCARASKSHEIIHPEHNKTQSPWRRDNRFAHLKSNDDQSSFDSESDFEIEEQRTGVNKLFLHQQKRELQK